MKQFKLVGIQMVEGTYQNIPYKNAVLNFQVEQPGNTFGVCVKQFTMKRKDFDNLMTQHDLHQIDELIGLEIDYSDLYFGYQSNKVVNINI